MPLLQERLVAPPYLPELKRGRRAFEYKAEVLSKQCHTGENMPVTVSNRGGALLLNGWQEAAMDLSKAGDLGIGGDVAATVGHMSHQVHPSSHKLPAMGGMQSVIQSAMQGSVGVDMAGILQAGLIHPVTGQIVNGNLRCDDGIMRRRRGRRRNVEAVDIGSVTSRGMHVQEKQVCQVKTLFWFCEQNKSQLNGASFLHHLVLMIITVDLSPYQVQGEGQYS